VGAAVGAFLLAWVPALSGHAAAAERLPALSIVADTLHVLGAGLWMGTLAVLLAAGLPAVLSRPGGGPAPLAAMVNAFSPVALAGGGVVAATGLVNALFHLGSPADLFGTTYGRALLLKLGLLAGVAALGAYNWRVVRPGLEKPETAARLRLSATTELALGVVVVFVTAILVALPTP
jgi:putative copper export protein